jgi:hypothetical protein
MRHAKRMGRRFIGIDVNERYVNSAQDRVPRGRRGDYPMLFVGSAKYPTKAELQRIAEIEAGSAGRKAESRYKRKTYGRKWGSHGRRAIDARLIRCRKRVL